MQEPTKQRPRSLILIVDDDADIAAFIERHLRDAGFEVALATDGYQGVDRTIDLRPDLVISNIVMSFMDGLEMTRRIRADHEAGDTPILLLTARDGARHKLDGLVAGADDYMTKPFDPRQLVARVRAVMQMTKVPGYSRLFERGEGSVQQALVYLRGLEAS